MVSGRSLRQRLTRVCLVRTTSSSRSGDGAPIMMPHSVLNAWVRALTALARVTRSVRITSTVPDLAFGIGLAEDRASDLLGIEAVGLAVHASGQPVGSVHLHHLFAGLDQCPGQGGTEGSGAFDTDRCDLAVSAHPGKQLVVAAVGGGELLVTEQPAMLVDDGCIVSVLVGVDTTNDCECFGCHAGIRSSVRTDLTDRANRPGGRQVCDGASCPSSYQVRSVWPVRAATLHQSRPTNRTQDTVVTPWPGSNRPGAAPSQVFTHLAAGGGMVRPGMLLDHPEPS